jgi:carboxyl-terminal processing protease
MPDYFVPLDTTMISPYVNKIFSTDTHREFILGYLENHGKDFDDMSFEQFYENYEVSDAMLQDLIQTAEKNKVPFQEDDYKKSKEYLKTLLKAHMGRSIYDDNAFYKIINDVNEVYQQAIKLFDEAEKLAFQEAATVQ